MGAWVYLAIMFIGKVVDNMLGTARTLLVQRNKGFLASIALVFSNLIYNTINRNIATSDSFLDILIVSIAGGVGCWLAVAINNRKSTEKTYINVIMSDDLDAMKLLRDFLAKNKITNTACDSYTLDWDKKTITITAYAKTKADSKLIDNYLHSSETKFKRVIANVI